LANYLAANDLCPKTITEMDGTIRFIALYAKNREEWVVTDSACILSGITVVTLYDTLGKESLEFILDQTYIKTIVLSADKIKNILELKKEKKIPRTSHVIYFDEVKPADF
jgi:long-chain acyl-CoA synthetase